MEITTRNLFCLLRAGVLGREESVEPMSAWKWSRVYGLSMVHGVEAETWAGIGLLKGQFFMRLPDALRHQWEQSAANARPAPRTPLTPRLAKRLERLEDEADRPADATLSVLRSMVALSQSLLTADRWVRQLLSLATLLSPPATHSARGGTIPVPPRIDREQLDEWFAELDMERMAQLECALLMHLLHIDEKRLPISMTLSEEQQREGVEEIAAAIEATTHQWQFSQGSNIFVHNSSSSAMYWQARHSVRYLKYHPKESISSFFSSFVQSLTKIEE